MGALEDGIYVADDGPRIPETDRERGFKQRVHDSRGWTGYGLSVVRSVIGDHGWNITVTESEDGGARFEITGIDFVNDQ